MERLDLEGLKKALEDGNIFDGSDKLKNILKKSEGVSDSEDMEEILDKRQERVDKEWEENEEEYTKEMKKDSAVMMEKRAKAQEFEMENAKIKFLENEISIHKEIGEQIQCELDMNQKKIDEFNEEIGELKEKIGE